MLQQSLLDRSWRTTILDEHDRRLVLPTDPERLRWDSVDVVAARMMALPFELIVAKPLVESHRTCELLDTFGWARGIWMLRHYFSVARSNLARFGTDNGFRDLRILVDRGPADWRGSGADEVRKTVAALLDSGLPPLDAAAVFWWARNRLYVDQDLACDSRIRVLRYEILIEKPQECLEALGDFVGVRLPLQAMKRRIRPVQRAHERLRPDVEALCSDLLTRLDKAPALRPS